MPKINFTSNPSGATAGPLCRAYGTVATQSVANGASGTVVWGTTSSDTSGMWSSGAPTRITIGEAGDYLVSGNVYWGVNTTGRRIGRVTINGTTWAQNVYTAGTDSNSKSSPVVDVIPGCVPTDYIELVGYQDCGGTLGIIGDSRYTYLTVKKIA
jgi:hypothetical protein